MKVATKYASALMLGLKSAMEYRADFFVSLLGGVFAVVIQCFLWTAIFGSSPQKVIFGYTYEGMITYVVMAGLFTKLMATGFEWEIAEDIKNGALSRYIVQPVSYFGYRVSAFLGRKCFQNAILLAATATVLSLLCKKFGLALTLSEVLYCCAASLLALILNCIIFYCISAAAFWMTEISGVFIGLGLVSTILSGGLFPLSIFGPYAQLVFDLLPFQYIISFPLNILEGAFGPFEILRGLLIQCVWIGILLLLSNRIWKHGTGRYIAAGG